MVSVLMVTVDEFRVLIMMQRTLIRAFGIWLYAIVADCPAILLEGAVLSGKVGM